MDFAAIGVFFLDFYFADEIKTSFADRLDAFLKGIDDGGGQAEKVGPERVLVPQRMTEGGYLAFCWARGLAHRVGMAGCHDRSPWLEAIFQIQWKTYVTTALAVSILLNLQPVCKATTRRPRCARQ